MTISALLSMLSAIFWARSVMPTAIGDPRTVTMMNRYAAGASYVAGLAALCGYLFARDDCAAGVWGGRMLNRMANSVQKSVGSDRCGARGAPR